MITKQHLAHLAKLKKLEADAYQKRMAYQQRVEDVCAHEAVFERGYGYEDTLGGYAPDRGTTEWHCAVCGRRLATAEGNCSRPAEFKDRVVFIPGSVTTKLGDVRADILRRAPQTYDDVAMQLLAAGVSLPLYRAMRGTG